MILAFSANTPVLVIENVMIRIAVRNFFINTMELPFFIVAFLVFLVFLVFLFF